MLAIYSKLDREHPQPRGPLMQLSSYILYSVMLSTIYYLHERLFFSLIISLVGNGLFTLEIPLLTHAVCLLHETFALVLLRSFEQSL